MINEPKIIKLNGQTNGFAIFICSKKKFLKNNREEIKLFKNLALAKSWLANKCGICNPYLYKVWIICGELEIDLDDTEYINGYFEYYDLNGNIYFIEEDITERVTNLGYIVFENGDTERCDKNYGKERCKDLFGYCKEVINDIIKYPNWIPAIESMGEDQFGHFMVSLKNCTGKIHILYVSQLMSFNVARKDAGKRCLPFETEIDKYLSIYIYCTKDISEPKVFGVEDKVIKIKDMIVDCLKDYYPDSYPRYRPVEFKGTIAIEGGELK